MLSDAVEDVGEAYDPSAVHTSGHRRPPMDYAAPGVTTVANSSWE